MIVEQQPQSVHEGLENLFNNTLLDGFECDVFASNATDSERVECSSTTESLILSLLPSDGAITVLIIDENGTTLLNGTLFSMPDPQALTYTTSRGDTHLLNISMQVVTSNGSDYYLVMLESSFGLRFQMAAIPLILPQTTGMNYSSCISMAWALAMGN